MFTVYEIDDSFVMLSADDEFIVKKNLGTVVSYHPVWVTIVLFLFITFSSLVAPIRFFPVLVTKSAQLLTANIPLPQEFIIGSEWILRRHPNWIIFFMHFTDDPITIILSQNNGFSFLFLFAENYFSRQDAFSNVRQNNQWINCMVPKTNVIIL